MNHWSKAHYPYWTSSNSIWLPPASNQKMSQRIVWWTKWLLHNSARHSGRNINDDQSFATGVPRKVPFKYTLFRSARPTRLLCLVERGWRFLISRGRISLQQCGKQWANCLCMCRFKMSRQATSVAHRLDRIRYDRPVDLFKQIPNIHSLVFDPDGSILPVTRTIEDIHSVIIHCVDRCKLRHLDIFVRDIH